MRGHLISQSLNFPYLLNGDKRVPPQRWWESALQTEVLTHVVRLCWLLWTPPRRPRWVSALLSCQAPHRALPEALSIFAALTTIGITRCLSSLLDHKLHEAGGRAGLLASLPGTVPGTK